MTSTFDRSSTSPDADLAEIFRSEWGRLLSLLVAKTRRLDLAEDALSEAFARAAQRWPTHGTPANPIGWLYTSAYRFVLGCIRTEVVAGRKASLLAVRSTPAGNDDADTPEMDDQLRLILLCCHPALSLESRSALALRLAVGTPTEQIARLFLVSESTMAARLTRAKKKITLANIPLASPVGEELDQRLNDVCRTIYLAFTAGYTPGTGVELLRTDLSNDAVRLALVLQSLVPNVAQVNALCALLIFQHARRDARVNDGLLITLEHQNRTLWHQREIAMGCRLLSRVADSTGYAEELRLQASVAEVHATAATASDTDWRKIADLYASLEAHTNSPIVRLNRAVADAEAFGPATGLQRLVGLEELLPSSHRLYAVRAELARRCGDHHLARESFDRAIQLCTNDVELRFLQMQRDSLDAD